MDAFNRVQPYFVDREVTAQEEMIRLVEAGASVKVSFITLDKDGKPGVPVANAWLTSLIKDEDGIPLSIVVISRLATTEQYDLANIYPKYLHVEPEGG